jgi:mRNA deadenylase 3'-5' endonuclease subunit Ccr4
MEPNLNYIETPNATKFVIGQFNVLAKKLADKDPVHGFPIVPQKYLDWEYRKPKIIDIVKDCDVFVLEEYVSEDWSHRMDFPDHDMVDIRSDNGQHGVALFWKPKVFRHIISGGFQLGETSQVARWIRLSPHFGSETNNSTFHSMLLVGTHLKHGQNPEAKKIRMKQVESLLEEIQDLKKPTDFVVLCGDMNATLHSQPMNVLTTNIMKFENVFRSFHRREGSGITSLAGKYTTNKWRYFKDSNVLLSHLRTEDYILLHDPLCKVQVDSGDISPDIGETTIDAMDDTMGMPNKFWPSDHCCLKIKFALRNEQIES